MAIALGKNGCDVIVHYKTSTLQAKAVVDSIKNQGVESTAIKADLCQWESVRDMMALIHSKFGRLDILVNNVGPFQEKPFSDITPADWHAMMDGNLSSTFYTCSAAWPIMKAQKFGRIINMGLANSDRIHSYKNIIPYGIAKSGVLILSKSLAVEGAPLNITVNVLAPGLMDNGETTSQTRDELIKNIPAGRFGAGADLIGALLFLVSDSANYINGAQIPVSGGWGL
jgi:3-oxoacyl-[acyl-carrier protein] reductase